MNFLFFSIDIFQTKDLNLKDCNDCHDVLVMSIDINSIAILNIRDVDYCCDINGISKGEAIDLSKNVNFSENIESL